MQRQAAACCGEELRICEMSGPHEEMQFAKVWPRVEERSYSDLETMFALGYGRSTKRAEQHPAVLFVTVLYRINTVFARLGRPGRRAIDSAPRVAAHAKMSSLRTRGRVLQVVNKAENVFPPRQTELARPGDLQRVPWPALNKGEMVACIACPSREPSPALRHALSDVLSFLRQTGAPRIHTPGSPYTMRPPDINPEVVVGVDFGMTVCQMLRPGTDAANIVPVYGCGLLTCTRVAGTPNYTAMAGETGS